MLCNADRRSPSRSSGCGHGRAECGARCSLLPLLSLWCRTWRSSASNGGNDPKLRQLIEIGDCSFELLLERSFVQGLIKPTLPRLK